MAIFTTFCKGIKRYLKLMLDIFLKKFWRVCNISMKTIYFLETWSFKIYFLMKKAHWKSQILAYQNLKFHRKILPIHIVEVHNIWPHKCSQSIYFSILDAVIHLKLTIMPWVFYFMNYCTVFLLFTHLKKKIYSWQLWVPNLNFPRSHKYRNKPKILLKGFLPKILIIELVLWRESKK